MRVGREALRLLPGVFTGMWRAIAGCFMEDVAGCCRETIVAVDHEYFHRMDLVMIFTALCRRLVVNVSRLGHDWNRSCRGQRSATHLVAGNRSCHLILLCIFLESNVVVYCCFLSLG